MIKVWILTAQMIGGFTMLPFPDEAACRAAMVTLSAAVITSAECYEIEMIQPSGSMYAPEMAPMPARKPGRSA